VNGIELNPPGFEKLFEEIELKTIELLIKHRKQRKIKIHTGRFPTANGYYKRLFIREAGVPRMDQETLNINGMTSRKYYEVCTNPDLIAHVEKKVAYEKEDGKRRMKKKMADEKKTGKHKNGS
ncbi:hypothetical protein QUF76_11795, partial [Desulfobacterales bacterium HSG16]|nr:hypothetical protein [Desulfobacterales bacterium HSG16]